MTIFDIVHDSIMIGCCYVHCFKYTYITGNIIMYLQLWYYIQKINEKPAVVVEFESGKAVVNHAILGKMERALGTYVCTCMYV